MIHAVYIGSNDYWGYDSDTFNEPRQFFGASWVIPASEVDESSISEDNLNRCALYYEVGKTDSHLFTPTTIAYNPDADFILITGEQGAIGEPGRTESRRRAYSLGQKGMRYRSMTDGPDSRGVGRFMVDYIVISDDSDIENIKDFIKKLDGKREVILNSNAEAPRGNEQSQLPCKLLPLPNRTSLINYLPTTTYPFENLRASVLALFISALSDDNYSHYYVALQYLLSSGHDVRGLITEIEDYAHPESQMDLDEILHSNFEEGMEEIFIKYLSSTEVDVFDDGVDLFGPDYEYSIPFLIKLYSDGDSTSRMNVVKCLADIGKKFLSVKSNELIFPLLRKALDDDCIDIVGEAADQLGRLGDVQPIPLLETLILGETNPSTLQISAGLSRLGSVIGAKKLVELMSEVEPSFQSFYRSKFAKPTLFPIFESVLYEEIFSNSHYLSSEATSSYLELCEDKNKLSDICTRIALETCAIDSESNLPDNAISMIEWGGDQALFEILRIIKFGPNHLTKKILFEIDNPPSTWVDSELLPLFIENKSDKGLVKVLANYGGTESHLQLFEELKVSNYIVNEFFANIFDNTDRLTNEWKKRLINLRNDLGEIIWSEINDETTTRRFHVAFHSPTRSSSRLNSSLILNTIFNSDVGDEDVNYAYNLGFYCHYHGNLMNTKSAENLLTYLNKPDPTLVQTAIELVPECEQIKPDDIEVLMETFYRLGRNNSEVPEAWVGWNINNINYLGLDIDQPEADSQNEGSYNARYFIREEILRTLGELLISSELLR